MRKNAARIKESPLLLDERLFLGLVRQGMLTYYVGRAAELTDEELRSVFALARAAMKEAERRSVYADVVPPSPADRAVGPQRARENDSKAFPLPGGYLHEA